MRTLIALLALLTSGSALAWTLDEPNKTVVMVGSHVPNTGFATVAEGLHANCIYQHLYFDLTTALGKSMMATLLTAKATGAKVRIGYSPPAATGTCTLELVNLM
jgi:hypothetical protein